METLVDRNLLAARLTKAVRAHSEPLATPIMVVDLAAFDANAADLARRAAGTPIRVASKSLRVPSLIRRALNHSGFAGVLAFTLREALWLVETQVSDDVVVAYPSVDQAALAQLADSASAAAAITLMVDDLAHLDLINSVQSVGGPRVRVCLDVDAGLRMGSAHLGPKRSPLYDGAAVGRLAREIRRRPGLVLVGLMTYEGQVAGVPDDVPGQRAKSLFVRRMKQASTHQLSARRREVLDALADAGVRDLEFFNAGGSGSIESTCADPSITEVAAGSGLLVPGLFDHYRAFRPRPAAFFALPVTRRPAPNLATVHGGGLIASGAAGPDRLPIPWAPPGLQLTNLEGAGEVQTPLTGHPAGTLQIGELVWFRHAKSGELFEHTNLVQLLRGGEFVESATTYRGFGQAF